MSDQSQLPNHSSDPSSTEPPKHDATQASDPISHDAISHDTDLTDAPSEDIGLIDRSKREFTDDVTGRSKKPNRFKGLAILAFIALIIGWVVFAYYHTMFATIEQPKQMITIDKGETYYGLIDKWDKKQKLFVAPLAKLYIKSKDFKPLHSGVYQIPENPSFAKLLDVLQQGEKVAFVKVQIIEGKTAKDLYQHLAANKGIKNEVIKGKTVDTAKLALPIPPEYMPNGNLEGWFSPDTYYFNEGSSDKKVLTDLFKRQYDALMQNWNNRQADLPYATPYDALIMASIIEKETSVPSERGEVAGVFVNRLKKNMRLQTDPTVIYGMGERYDGNIRKSDLAEKTAYNTYQIDGLPPTPIALPSVDSIKAALHPNDTDSLYFVATGNGGHKFTSNLADHNQAVQDYLRVMREKRAQQQ